MATYTIKRYEPSDAHAWNSFVRQSKNGTFLFDRNFMDYHSDRFEDYSLLVFDGAELLAVLPAHVTGNRLYSHWGLTYGGLVYGKTLKLKQVIAALQSLLEYLFDAGIATLHLKAIPAIYHQLPSDELSYALFACDAKLARRDSLSVLDLAQPFSISKTRRESIRRGEKNELSIREEPNFELFWTEILIPNLSQKHAAKPVHSVAEIQLLHERFPENIRHFNVYCGPQIVAGTTVFVTETVAHPQYISGNARKNELGSLDYLYHYLIKTVFPHKRYFDFGISNEDQGRKLNEGLVFWKESFGCNTVAHDFYDVETKNFTLLESVLI